MRCAHNSLSRTASDMPGRSTMSIDQWLVDCRPSRQALRLSGVSMRMSLSRRLDSCSAGSTDAHRRERWSQQWTLLSIGG